MTNKELAAKLNERLSLQGEARVTVDVIRQWVGWKLLPHAAGRGRSIGLSRQWSRDHAASARADRLGELRAAGLVGEEEVRVQLWLEGAEFDLELVRSSLAYRARRVINRLLRPVTSTLDPATEAPSLVRKHALARQLGKRAPMFRGSPLELGEDEVISAYGAARFGSADEELLPKLLKALLPEVSGADLLDVGVLGLGMNGSLGSPDEIEGSALEAIKTATASELELARRLFSGTTRNLEALAASELSPGASEALRSFQHVVRQILPTISIGPWPLSIFMTLLNSVMKLRGNLRPLIKTIEENEALHATNS